MKKYTVFSASILVVTFLLTGCNTNKAADGLENQVDSSISGVVTAEGAEETPSIPEDPPQFMETPEHGEPQIDDSNKTEEKYQKETQGLSRKEKEALKVVFGFYGSLQKGHFENLKQYVINKNESYPSLVTKFYRDTYKKNNIKLITYTLQTIELDESTGKRVVVKVESTLLIKGKETHLTEQIELYVSSYGEWKINALKAV